MKGGFDSEEVGIHRKITLKSILEEQGFGMNTKFVRLRTDSSGRLFKYTVMNLWFL
jgi:hypothetical protein